MDEQERVAAFVEAHELGCDPTHRILDLTAEVGEIAADLNAATDYGDDPEAAAVAEDEVGDALFSLLAAAAALDVDAGEALEASLAKYERRIEASGSPGSETSQSESDG